MRTAVQSKIKNRQSKILRGFGHRLLDVAMDDVNRHLLEIVRRYGTPTYAFDVRRLREQVAKLRSHLPPAVEILYSLKANASLGICDVLAGCGIGADVASAGELATDVEAGFPSQDR